MSLRTVCVVIGFALTASTSVSAQNWSVAPAPDGKPEATAPKTKGVPAKRTGSVQHLSAEGDKAARMEENRKKFFDQQSGFDNGRSGDLPISAGSGSNGQFQPGMGFKF